MGADIQDNSIGNRLKELRNGLKLNQKEMADRIHITRAYWSALELGNRELTGNIIRSLMREFKISADWLLAGKVEAYTHDKKEDFESKVDRDYTRIIWIVELYEKQIGPSDEYDKYLNEIVDIIKLVRTGSKDSIQSDFKLLHNWLVEEFNELFKDYCLVNLSLRTRSLKILFNPPRYFHKLKFSVTKILEQ